MKYLLLLFIFIISCEIAPKSGFKHSNNKLWIQWADGKTEVYQGSFIDYPDRIRLIRTNLIIEDTLRSDSLIYYYGDLQRWSLIDSSFIGTDSTWIYVRDSLLWAMPTNLMKCQMKRYDIGF